MRIQEKIVGIVDSGSTLSEKHTVVCRFRNFESLTHKRKESVCSPCFECHGHIWRVVLFPGGSENSDKAKKYVSVYLRWLNPDESKSSTLNAIFTCRLGSTSMRSVRLQFQPGKSKGFGNFLPRSQVLDGKNNFLVNGTLEMKVDIQLYHDVEKYSVPRQVTSPKNTLAIDMLRMLESGKHADVTFLVDDQEFHAHQAVLEARAPFLANLAEDFPDHQVIPIPGVEPRLFELFLHFIYSNTLPHTVDLKTRAMDLLHVANKFDCPSLKAAAEAEIFASGITVETAAEILLFADRMDCVQLKEATMHFFVENRKAVMKSKGFSKLQESPKLTAEMLETLSQTLPSS